MKITKQNLLELFIKKNKLLRYSLGISFFLFSLVFVYSYIYNPSKASNEYISAFLEDKLLLENKIKLNTLKVSMSTYTGNKPTIQIKEMIEASLKHIDSRRQDLAITLLLTEQSEIRYLANKHRTQEFTEKSSNVLYSFKNSVDKKMLNLFAILDGNDSFLNQ